jgi:L-lactate utilization protein LutB
MDNDTYDDRHSTQQTFNKNIVKRIQELEDKRPSKLDDQVDIKLMKQEEWNEKVIERLDQEIENRTRAFQQIEDLEDDIRMIKEYSIDGLKDSLRDLEYNVDVKLERIEEILVVHRNQDRAQKKNYKALRDVWDKTVMKIIEKGEHGKQE